MLNMQNAGRRKRTAKQVETSAVESALAAVQSYFNSRQQQQQPDSDTAFAGWIVSELSKIPDEGLKCMVKRQISNVLFDAIDKIRNVMVVDASQVLFHEC